VCAVGKRIPHGAILAQIEALNLPHCALPLGSVAPNLEANHPLNLNLNGVKLSMMGCWTIWCSLTQRIFLTPKALFLMILWEMGFLINFILPLAKQALGTCCVNDMSG